MTIPASQSVLNKCVYKTQNRDDVKSPLIPICEYFASKVLLQSVSVVLVFPLNEERVYKILLIKYTHLISRFLFMIAHTREFPTILKMTSTENTVAMATPADSDIMEEYQRSCRDT